MKSLRLFVFFISVLFATGYIIENPSMYSFAQSPVNSDSLFAGKRLVTSPLPGEFPIVASTVFNSQTGPKKGDLKGIKECGFNLCMHSASAEQFEKLLGYMDGTGLKLLMHNSSFQYHSSDKFNRWKEDIPNFINKFKNKSLVAGWEFQDEPKWEDLSELQKRYELLKQIDSSHFILINLVGQIAKKFTGPCETLEIYLDSIQDVFDMNVWSSDYYPIMIKEGKFIVNYQGFFTNLEVFSAKSKATGLPMWAYCESMEYTSKSHSRPAATLPYLSFEAFSALAYGAQGIVYWTYWQRPSNMNETYLSALVDLEGNRTKAWYAAQKVNFQIKALTPVFLGATMVECRHTGVIKMEITVPYIEHFGPLRELRSGVEGVLVSLLKNDDKNYIMIVNHDVENKQKVNIRFIQGINVTELSVTSLGTIKKKSVKSSHNLTLSPGGYTIFEWK